MGGAISDLVSRVNNLELLLKSKKSPEPNFALWQRVMFYNETTQTSKLPAPIDADNKVKFQLPDAGVVACSIVAYQGGTKLPAIWAEDFEVVHTRTVDECEHGCVTLPKGAWITCENVKGNYHDVTFAPLKGLLDS